MNGMCCRWLLDNVDAIFEDVGNLVSERLKCQSGISTEQIHLLTQTVSDFKSIFEILDLVFSKLQIIDPSPDEIV